MADTGPFVRWFGSDQYRWRYDDTVRRYYEYAEDGTVLVDRPYTPAEVADADARELVAQQDSNAGVVTTKLSDALAELDTLIGTSNSTINGGPAPYVKALARILRLVLRALLRRFEGTT